MSLGGTGRFYSVQVASSSVVATFCAQCAYGIAGRNVVYCSVSAASVVQFNPHSLQLLSPWLLSSPSHPYPAILFTHPLFFLGALFVMDIRWLPSCPYYLGLRVAISMVFHVCVYANRTTLENVRVMREPELRNVWLGPPAASRDPSGCGNPNLSRSLPLS